VLILATVGLLIGGAYVGTASYLWMSQGRLIFGKPKMIRHIPDGPLGACYQTQSISLEVEPGVFLDGWRSVPTDGSVNATIIYNGGRNEDVAWTPALCSHIQNCSVWAFNYRGIGNSGGASSEVSAKRDADLIVQHVKRIEGDVQLAVIGRSLGTAIALHIAKASQCEKLVLISPFESLRGVIKKHPVLRSMTWLMTQSFDCTEDARSVVAEAAVILAPDDKRVSNATSVRLAHRIDGLKLIQSIPGTTHQSLPRNSETLTVMAGFLQGMRT
jgi:uncharacterized protein